MEALTFTPATHWQLARPVRRRAGNLLGKPTPEQSAALLQLMRESLKKGHWKVAVRRFYMMVEFGCSIPDEELETCRAFAAQMDGRELKRVREDVRAWAHFVRLGLEPRSDTMTSSDVLR